MVSGLVQFVVSQLEEILDSLLTSDSRSHANHQNKVVPDLHKLIP